MLKTPTLSPSRPSRGKTRQCPSVVLGSQKILDVPHIGKELSWQLGEGGWKLSRLRFLLVCGLACGKARLGAPGLASEKAAVLSIRSGLFIFNKSIID